MKTISARHFTSPLCPAILLTLLSLAANVTQAGLVIPGLYNTGVDDSGNVLPVDAQDPHYALFGAASQAYIVPIVFHHPGDQAWVTPPAGSAWIGPMQTTSTWPKDPSGNYYYDLTITIDLTGTGYDPAKLQISGLWSADDTSRISVNGLYTGFSTANLALSSFLLQGCFTSGINVLEFQVVNNSYPQYPSGNPSGLLVAGLAAADDGSLTLPSPPASPVPEPSTFIAGALLALPLALQVIRRRVCFQRCLST